MYSESGQACGKEG